MFVQNFIKLSSLDFEQTNKKNSDRNNTVRRYRADSKNTTTGKIIATSIFFGSDVNWYNYSSVKKYFTVVCTKNYIIWTSINELPVA